MKQVWPLAKKKGKKRNKYGQTLNLKDAAAAAQAPS